MCLIFFQLNKLIGPVFLITRIICVKAINILDSANNARKYELSDGDLTKIKIKINANNRKDILINANSRNFCFPLKYHEGIND